MPSAAAVPPPVMAGRWARAGTRSRRRAPLPVSPFGSIIHSRIESVRLYESTPASNRCPNRPPPPPDSPARKFRFRFGGPPPISSSRPLPIGPLERSRSPRRSPRIGAISRNRVNRPLPIGRIAGRPVSASRRFLPVSATRRFLPVSATRRFLPVSATRRFPGRPPDEGARAGGG